jgi:hypothetical protein
MESADRLGQQTKKTERGKGELASQLPMKDSNLSGLLCDITNIDFEQHEPFLPVNEHSSYTFHILIRIVVEMLVL